MAIIFKRFRLLHFPRTGGKWRRKICREHGIPHALWNPKHSTPNETGAIELPTAVFIREPIDWYRSYFSYKMTVGFWGSKSEPLKDFDREVNSDTFEGFLKRVLERKRGFFSEFIGEFLEGSQIILPFRDMARGFIGLLKYFSETRDKWSISSISESIAINSSMYNKCNMRCDPSVVKDVVESEIDYKSQIKLIGNA